MPLLLNTHFHLATESLRKNRGRTFLSALGIAIGVASVVLILSLTGSIQKRLGVSSDRANANLILIRPNSGKDPSANLIDELTANNQYAKSSLAITDLELVKSVDGVSAAAPIASFNAPITIGDHTVDGVNILATTNSLPKTTPLNLKSGQFIPGDNHDNSAVIGANLSMQLFGTTEAITRTFSYNNQRFMVTGILEETDDPINYNGVDFDNSIIVSLAFLNTFEPSIQIQQINLRTDTTDHVTEVSQKLYDKLSSAKNSSQSFSIISGESNFQPVGSLLSIISGMLTLIASISLVVGGVGIMNIMLVSVSERTREIGIRKAVGASASNILLQFLFEAIILSLLGGILGFALGYICAFFIALAVPFAPHLSLSILAITGGITLLIGVVFGIYPAAKAANKDPITSLKFYR